MSNYSYDEQNGRKRGGKKLVLTCVALAFVTGLAFAGYKGYLKESTRAKYAKKLLRKADHYGLNKLARNIAYQADEQLDRGTNFGHACMDRLSSLKSRIWKQAA